jgi:hypothetical protein
MERVSSPSGEAAMRGTLIPLPDFLDAVIRACAAAPSSGKWYLGVVVVLDRRAERRSCLLDELVREGSSINDVTRKDLLVAVPGQQHGWWPGVDEWIDQPTGPWYGVGAAGLLMAGVDHDDWAGRLWELVSDQVELCDNAEDQERIRQAVDQSASSVCDYLGLTEDDIPSLAIFSLADRRIFVFRYGGDADDSPYQLFKDIARRRPSGERRDWLTTAVEDIARESGLTEGQAPELTPRSLADWQATRYLPRDVNAPSRERARG